MNTRENILNTALKVYNDVGFGLVTTRYIANEMKISAGNLHYHFKHKEDIVLELFDRLTKEFDELMLLLRNSDVFVLDSFIEQSFLLISKYRFVFLSFTEICSSIPNIRKSYIEINKRRQSEFVTVFKKYMQDDIFRKDIPNWILNAMVTNVFVIGDFWQSYNMSSFNYTGKKAMLAFKESFKGLFFPYLTNKGLELFDIPTIEK